MSKLAVVCAGLMLAAPAWAQQQPTYFEYTCVFADGVEVGADGALVRNASTQDYVKRQSPFVFDTVTGQMRRAAAPPGIVEEFKILDHGSAISQLQAYDTTIGLGSVLHIRVDMPGPPYRFIFQKSGSAYSGTCQRTPM